MLSVEGNKAIALSLLFLIILIISLLPLYMRKMFFKLIERKRAEMILSGCLCFGAGILMATVFLHILPEAVRSVDGAMKKGIMTNVSYPVTELVFCAGFFLVYLVEEIVHQFLDGHKNPSKNVFHRNSEGDEESNRDEINQDPVTPHHDHAETHEALKNHSMIGSMMVVVALSFHGLMEGMAIGLETDVDNVWIIFCALVSHKVFISFSMSMELLEGGASLKVLVSSMVIFSAASPIGGIVGIVVTAVSSQSQTAAGVLAPAFLQAVSSGTILYVTFCEVLERERAKSTSGLIKLACMLVGFGIMSGLQTLQ